jgi:hypothetical protein
MVEKYLCSNHARKHELICEILSPNQRKTLEAITTEFAVQPPDLFVFAPSHLRFWFAEVKGPGDKIHNAQKLSHEAIQAKLGLQVELIWVAACNGLQG